MRIIVAGGGTAGHITPTLAIVDELKDQLESVDVLFIGSGSALERTVLKHAKISYVGISAGKYRRYNRGLLKAALDLHTNWQNFRDMFKVVGGLYQSYRILRKFKPDVVFIKGSYVGVPVGIAARRLKIPTVLHDSDAKLSRTTQILAKAAAEIGVGWPVEQYREYALPNLVYVGIPIRPEILEGSRSKAQDQFKLDIQKPNILIYGGSRGAHIINEAIFENIQMLSKRYNVLHVTGESDAEQARFLASRLEPSEKKRYKVFEYLHKEVGLAYACADVVIARAGATTIAELAAWKKATILIPYAAAANQDQWHNAQLLSKAGAARVIDQEKLAGLRLMSEIDRLIDSASDRKYLSEQIAKFARPHAARDVAQLIRQASKSTHHQPREKSATTRP